jgi:hypothetical protein
LPDKKVPFIGAFFYLVKPDKGHLDLYPPMVLYWRRYGRVSH